MPFHGNQLIYGDPDFYGAGAAPAVIPGDPTQTAGTVIVYTRLLDTRDLSLGKAEPLVSVGEDGFWFQMNSGFVLGTGDSYDSVVFEFVKPDGTDAGGATATEVSGSSGKFRTLIPVDFFDLEGRWQVQIHASMNGGLKNLKSDVETFSVGPSLND